MLKCCSIENAKCDNVSSNLLDLFSLAANRLSSSDIVWLITSIWDTIFSSVTAMSPMSTDSVVVMCCDNIASCSSWSLISTLTGIVSWLAMDGAVTGLIVEIDLDLRVECNDSVVVGCTCGASKHELWKYYAYLVLVVLYRSSSSIQVLVNHRLQMRNIHHWEQMLHSLLCLHDHVMCRTNDLPWGPRAAY